ncbi:MAG: DUF1284 domain-containing protein [Rhodobacteraceae bacterium]|jgi:Uncharacterized conserved protein|uniref:DUF1284 domain-containing protein n=1 Tax=Thioclava marina TaxID=1915077 RepID=A0ABX3MMN3_9RHOB|nr:MULTISPECIES: DUF1284 domain-containing protein [Thioclava]OOY12804.1 hypothetical protein BMG00_02985 [Thioclava marina]OOY28029.1 hypothetical protein BMI90_09070 [Thioclava sp. L04-15]TNE87244.1 MAG: DUF1284 domain-containing protein [Paracoccaceae bacterium]TNF14532.1 MAG: DUF1284 domain-containing protein [Paracoccaceae bacterium]
MRERLKYRPHHFLCSLGFEGKGYSEDFTANMSAIVEGTLRRADGVEVEIEVVGAADDICAPCPSRRGALCVAQDRIAQLDAAHGHALGIAPGDVLRWGEALERIAALPEGALEEICAGCQWLAGGMCAKALARLKAER